MHLGISDSKGGCMSAFLAGRRGTSGLTARSVSFFERGGGEPRTG